MERLCVTPPQTLGTFKPASRPTSTNVTGEGPVGVAALAVSRKRDFFHRHSGAVSASRSALPSKIPDEPRKRRRGKFMTGGRTRSGVREKFLGDFRSDRRALRKFSSPARDLRKIARHYS